MTIRFAAGECLLGVIDVQGKLARMMHGQETLFKNIGRMIEGAKILGLPILSVEQNPKGLGPTAPELAALIPGQKPIEKMSFSCCGCEDFMKALKEGARKQVLLTGIEAHVCIYQTASDLVRAGYDVGVVTDAVSSRTAENKAVGIDRMRDEGVVIASTEMVLFEMMADCRAEGFKRMIALFKGPNPS